MARYISYMDGGKTDEKGISQHLSGLFTGEVINGLAVAQNSPLAMIVTVSKGRCMIDSGSDYPYLGFTDGTESVNVNTADGSNPRIDTLVAYVDKAVVDSTTSNNPNAFKFKAVAGTPAGSPVAPNSAAISSSIGAGNPYIKLANIAVGAGVTTITNGNITDTRVDTSAVLADDVVTTAKIADGAVTPDKLSPTYVETIGTTNRTFTTSWAATGESITLAAGTWVVSYKLSYSIALSALSQGLITTLSTSTSSSNNIAKFLGVSYAINQASGIKELCSVHSATGVYVAASSTTLYLMAQTQNTTSGTILAANYPILLTAFQIG